MLSMVDHIYRLRVEPGETWGDEDNLLAHRRDIISSVEVVGQLTTLPVIFDQG